MEMIVLLKSKILGVNRLLLMPCAVLCSLLFLSSCKSVATFDELSSIHRGMTPSEVSKMVDLETKDMFNFSVDGKDYHAETYPIQLSQHSSTSSFTAPGSYGVGGFSPGRTTTTTTTTITTAPFICLYYKEQLLFWGFLNDYSKSDEPLITTIAPALYREYYMVYERP